MQGFGVPTWADGAQLLLIVLFALASTEKILTVRSRAAQWHPVMLIHTSWRGHAVQLLMASAIADIVAGGLLLTAPRLGGPFSATLTICYTWAAYNVHDSTTTDRGCGCFWGRLNSKSRAGMIARNLILLGLAVVATTSGNAVHLAGVITASLLGAAVITATTLVDTLAHRYASDVAHLRGADV